jgi:hypothetical protein
MRQHTEALFIAGDGFSRSLCAPIFRSCSLATNAWLRASR